MNQFLQDAERDASIPKTDGRFAELPKAKIEGGHFSDVFRRLHPDEENGFTNWCTLTGARQTNYGRRLDYILVDQQLAKYATQCEILADVHGSDHCPVVLTLDCEPISSTVSPDLCSKFMPEFRGQQKKLSAFFSKVSNSNCVTKSDNGNEEAVTSSPVENFSSVSISHPNSDSLSSSLSVPSSNSSLSSLPKPTLKRQSTSQEKFQGKKSKFKKELSSQSSLKFFYLSSAKSNKPTKDLETDKIHMNNHSIQNEVSFSSGEMTTNSSLDSSVVVQTIAFLNKSQSSENSSQSSISNTKKAWKNILGGLPPPPLCSGHKEPSVLRTVKKEGLNKNKQFYVCCKPDGPPNNPLSRCNFFQWLDSKKR